MNAPRSEIEYLVRSDHRVAVLELLADRPRDRSELRSATGASASTMSRILAAFEERRWLARNGHRYELTVLGAFVADRLSAFTDAMQVERTLRDVAPWLPYEMDGFSVELFTDVVISNPGPGYPYRPVERIAQLLRESETMRGFGMAVLKSSNLDAFFDHVVDDIDCEYIYPPHVFEALLSWDAETVMDATTRPTYTVLLHGSLPLHEWCGVCIFDDRTCICCYEPESGLLRALVDTESPAMRNWAASLYERYRDEARPLEEADTVVSSSALS